MKKIPLVNYSVSLLIALADEHEEILRAEIADIRRAASQEMFEKEAVLKTANDLRNMVKRLEGEKVELNRLIQDLKARVTG